MIAIDEEQYAALASNYRHRLRDDFVRRIRLEFPRAETRYAERELLMNVDRDLAMAEGNGFTQVADLWRFVRLRHATDLESQSDTRRRFLAHILGNREVTPAKRVAFIEGKILNPRA